MIRKILLFLLVISSQAMAKVLIFTHSHSRPDFIELQDKTFKAFLKEDYDFVVFNDAPNNNMRIAIEQTCQKLNIRCIRVPQELHQPRNDPGSRHTHGIQYALKTIVFQHDDIAFLIDSDMFLFKPFSIGDFVGNNHIVGQKDVRPHQGIVSVTYMTPLLVFMNMKTMPNKTTLNFEGGYINGHACDVGGHLHYYFQNNPTLNIKFTPGVCVTALAANNTYEELLELGYDDITATWVLSLKNYFDPSDPHRLQFHGENNFMHYVAGGSNWNGRSEEYHAKKTRIINHFIDKMIERYA